LIKRIPVIVFIILSLCSSEILSAPGENPFISKQTEKKVQKTLDYPAFFQNFIIKIGSVQKKLNRRISELSREIKTGSKLNPVLLLISIAFIYGVIHALGPGHGKIVAFSYFLTEQNSVRKGIIFGALIAFTQVVSAIIVVLILYYVMRQAFILSFESFSRIMKLVSSILIICLGSFLVVNTILNLRKKSAAINNSEIPQNNKKLLSVALSIGVVPCPGAVILLLFTINIGILFIGIPLALIMALGMTVTISSIGSFTIVAKKSILKFTSTRYVLNLILYSGLKISGAFFIVVIGSLILLGNL